MSHGLVFFEIEILCWQLPYSLYGVSSDVLQLRTASLLKKKFVRRQSNLGLPKILTSVVN